MERNKKIDFIRAFAIISVVIGHCIQFGSGPEYYSGACLEDTVFIFIYSFHMPLFMLLSGYLFYMSSCKHSFLENAATRFTTLFIPIIAWNIVPFIKYTYPDRPHTFRYLFKAYLSTMAANSWFLWSLFYCSFAVLIVKQFFKDRIVIYLIGLILTFFITDSHNLSLYKFMYPYFIIGYFYHKRSAESGIDCSSLVKNRKFSIIITAIFFSLLCFYNNSSYIYTTGYTLLGKDLIPQLGIDIYRFIIGLLGCLFIIILLLNIYLHLNEKIIGLFSVIGVNSLGIYMISGLIFQYLLPNLTRKVTGINYLLVLTESVIILLVSILISLGIKKCLITNFLFFGGRK